MKKTLLEFVSTLPKTASRMAAVSAAAFSMSAFADVPRYTLGKSTASTDNAFADASFWIDENGNLGTAGATPDPGGDYYSGGTYYLCTRNAGDTFHFNAHSLQLGEVGGDSAKFLNYPGSSRGFGVLNAGLFLNRGYISNQYLPFEICDTVTVMSPESDPFQIYSTYGFNDPNNSSYANQYGTFSAAFKSESGRELWIYHTITKSKDKGIAKNSTYLFKFTGDYSAYFGTLCFGRDDETYGLVTKASFQNGAFPGTVKLKSSAVLSIGAADLSVGNIALSDGASIETAGGALVVTGAVTQTAAVNVIVNVDAATLPNVESPEIPVLTVGKNASVDQGQFSISWSGAGGTSLAWRDNRDGTKTLSVALRRASCYVSESGDDDAVGDADHPFKTLSKAVSVVTDGVIYVLPGTYDGGSCDAGDGTGTIVQSRVHVPSRVFLKSTQGADRTVIKGVKPENANYGPGAMRCVRLDSGAVVQGFTLTGGYGASADDDASGQQANRYGGAAFGADSSVVMDCIIDGNFARRGGGVFGGNYVRCLFGTNTCNYAGTGRDAFASNTQKTRVFDSVFTYTSSSASALIYNLVDAYNCTFAGEGNCFPKQGCRLCNCIIRATKGLDSTSNTYEHCVLAMTPTTSSTVGCVVTNLSDALDLDYRPNAGCAAIDFGDATAYFDAWDAAGISRGHMTDFRGGRRIYNGAVDAGCGEYDWRGDYTSKVGRPWLTVDEASANVSTCGDDKLQFVDGTSVLANWNSGDAASGSRIGCNAAVVGTGVLTVFMDGEAVKAVTAGTAEVSLRAETSGNHEIVFAFSGEGSATIDKFSRSAGLCIIFR